jgi:hypothetical protein
MSYALLARIANLQRTVERAQRLVEEAMLADAEAFASVEAGLQKLTISTALRNVCGITQADVECSICLEGSNLVSMNRCGHAFHFRCIKEWTLTGARVCPYCRTDLFD